ncbi:MAG: anti-sigma factor family protein [Miltoncostaeaceae bacterium]
MTHEEASPRLADLLWMRVADAEDAELRSHVDTCATCAERLAELRRVHAALAGVDRSDPPPGLAERVGEIPARYSQDATASPRGSRRLLAGVGGVAAAAVATGVVALALLGGGEPAEPGPFQAVDLVAVADPDSAIAGRIEMGEARAGMRSIRLAVNGLDTTGGRYELWLTGASGEVSAGTFRPDKNGACVVMLSAPDDEWTAATIVRAGSDEPPVVTVDL